MKKTKRPKVHREWLENQLAKYERRIQKLAENAYYIRQAIEILDAQEKQPSTKIDTGVNTEIIEASIPVKE